MELRCNAHNKVKPLFEHVCSLVFILMNSIFVPDTLCRNSYDIELICYVHTGYKMKSGHLVPIAYSGQCTYSEVSQDHILSVVFPWSVHYTWSQCIPSGLPKMSAYPVVFPWSVYILTRFHTRERPVDTCIDH